MRNHPELTTRESILIKKQQGQCNWCKQDFKTGDKWEVDHIIPKSEGGKDSYDNLQLLHRHCHDQKTAKDIQRQTETLETKDGEILSKIPQEKTQAERYE